MTFILMFMDVQVLIISNKSTFIKSLKQEVSTSTMVYLGLRKGHAQLQLVQHVTNKTVSCLFPNML
jgi:hypothetical protein